MHNNPSLHVLGFTGGGDILRGFNPEVGFTAPQLKPRFYLFQRVRDQLYLTPPTLEEHTSSTGVYLGVLGFTQPLEKLVLHAVPLQNLLDWLSQPKGPNLVEASVATAPDRALVLAVTKRMLYGEETPLVGVGLIYVVRRHGRLAPHQPLSVCALLPTLRDEQASTASWEPRPPFEVAEMD